MDLHLGIVRMTEELLLSILHFPEGTRIRHVRLDEERVGELVFVFEHLDLKVVRPGCTASPAYPTWKRTYAKEGNDQFGTVEFMGWGQ